MDQQELDTQIQQADALYQAGKLEAALEQYRAILAHDDTVAWAHSRVGAILAQRNDLDGAEQAFLHAIARNPKLPQAHSNLGNIYYGRGDYEAALAKYKEAVALDSTNPTFHENLHAAYKKLGKYTEAVASLKQSHRVARAQAKEEAKDHMDNMKKGMFKRKGCLGTATMMLVSALLLVTLFALL